MKIHHFLWAAVAMSSAAVSAQTIEADLILHNGVGIPMTGAEDRVEAIAVDDGIIIAVGSDESVMAHRGADSEVVDLQGQTFLPGFIDAHGHFLGVGVIAGIANLSPPPVGGASDIAAVQQSMRDYLAANEIPPGEWVVGFGYDDSLLAENRHPTRHDLDAVSTNHPIIATHTSGHLAVMNSAALAIAGIDADTPDPEGGIIRREADGRTPNGVLEETAYFAHMGLATSTDPAELMAALLRAQGIYVSNGITTAQDGRISPGQLQLMQAAQQNNLLQIDVGALLGMGDDWGDMAALPIGGEYQNGFRIAGLKLVLDGSPQGRTAWLHDPVPVPPDGQEAGYSGYPTLTDETLAAYLSAAAENGWQVFAHVNGDAAAQQLIDQVAASGIAPDARTVAIHNQVVTADQLARQRELGIHPSFFVAHTFFWGDWHRDVALGPVRADFISPQRTALDLDLMPTIHNDAPIIPPDMMRLVWTSVTRRTRSGDILGPTQRVSPYDALTMITRNAAWQIGEEDSKGQLVPGMRADIVVLSADPTGVATDELLEIDIELTLKDGEAVFANTP